MTDLTTELIAMERLAALSSCKLIANAHRVFPDATTAQQLVLGELYRRIDPQWHTRCQRELDAVIAPITPEQVANAVRMAEEKGLL